MNYVKYGKTNPFTNTLSAEELKNTDPSALTDLLKSLAKSLGFEIVQEIEKPYNPEFVKEILEAEQSIKEGKGVRIKLEDLWK